MDHAYLKQEMMPTYRELMQEVLGLREERASAVVERQHTEALKVTKEEHVNASSHEAMTEESLPKHEDEIAEFNASEGGEELREAKKNSGSTGRLPAPEPQY